MKRKTNRLDLAKTALVLAFLGASLAYAQTSTTTSESVSFEVLAVEGNSLVVRNQKGTQEYVVPDSFRFMVNGQPRSVHELTKGMKGTAVITTTVTVKPVYVTEVRDVVVVSSRNNSVTVRGADGVKRYSQDQLDARNVSITVNDKPMRVEDLEPGDKLTARIITRGPPVVMTEKEVDALLGQPEVLSPAPAVAAAPAPADAAAPAAATEVPVAAATQDAAPETLPTVEAAVVSEPAAEVARPMSWLYWLLGLVVVAILAWVLFGRSKKS